MNSSRINIDARYFIIIFVFTIPLESVNLSFISKAFSLTKLAGVLLFFFYLIDINKNTHCTSPTFWSFFVYLVFFIINSAFSKNFVDNNAAKSITIFQLVFFFWIALNIFREQRLVIKSLIAYVASSSLLASAILLRLPGFTGIVETKGYIRINALGEDPNVLGAVMALAVIIVIGMLLNNNIQSRIARYSLAVSIIPISAAIVKTGSRTAMAAFMAGVLVYFLPMGWVRSKRLTIFFAFIGMAVMIYLVSHDSTASSRWQETFSEGQTSGRTIIYRAAIQMISEKPLFGWSPEAYYYELGKRTRGWGKRDAHNLFLHLLLEGGLVGAFPFFVGIFFCIKDAWKGRQSYLGSLPLAVLLTIITANLTVNLIYRKSLWMVLALASVSVLHQRQRHLVVSRKSSLSFREVKDHLIYK